MYSNAMVGVPLWDVDMSYFLLERFFIYFFRDGFPDCTLPVVLPQKILVPAQRTAQPL